MTSSTYAERAAPAELAAVVQCVWSQRVSESSVGSRAGLGFEQPVLPDACVDLLVVDGSVVVAGPATSTVTAHLAPGSVTVGVRFRTGAAPAVLGVAASELRDRTVPLGELWGAPGAGLAKRCAAAPQHDRATLLVAAVRDRLASGGSGLDRAAVGVAAMIARQPHRPVSALAGHVGLSERQLRRRIDDAVGYSPRMLMRVVRFQRFLAAARAADPSARDLARLAISSGYADQAHLTRESTRLAGVPPARLLALEADRLWVPDRGGRPNRSRRAAVA